jgi:hypothetical protein
MSNFFMVSVAAVTRAALPVSGSLIMSKNTLGTTCQCRPYLSAAQRSAEPVTSETKDLFSGASLASARGNRSCLETALDHVKAIDWRWHDHAGRALDRLPN